MSDTPKLTSEQQAELDAALSGYRNLMGIFKTSLDKFFTELPNTSSCSKEQDYLNKATSEAYLNNKECTDALFTSSEENIKKVYYDIVIKNHRERQINEEQANTANQEQAT